MSAHTPFYGKTVNRHAEQEYINAILAKYKDERPDDALLKKVYDELMWEKHLGNVTIPFKVSLFTDPEGLFPDAIEVTLDSKV